MEHGGQALRTQPICWPGPQRRRQSRADLRIKASDICLTCGHAAEYDIEGTFPERRAAGGGKGKNSGKAPFVGGGGGLAASDQLRRHEPRRADDKTRACQASCLTLLRDSEID
jgi:hypothetical protein